MLFKCYCFLFSFYLEKCPSITNPFDNKTILSESHSTFIFLTSTYEAMNTDSKRMRGWVLVYNGRWGKGKEEWWKCWNTPVPVWVVVFGEGGEKSLI